LFLLESYDAPFINLVDSVKMWKLPRIRKIKEKFKEKYLDKIRKSSR